jgi:hypothetical protein
LTLSRATIAQREGPGLMTGSNNQSLKSRLKSWLLPSGRSPRRIRAGLLRGLPMQLDLAHHSQRWLGLQERELYGWMRQFARNINTAVDVGANDGMYTLYFLARTSARKVYSFEPSVECLQKLKENLAVNNLTSDERLEIVARNVGASGAEGWTTLDSLASTIVPPCLIKVDIDGGEGDYSEAHPHAWACRQCDGSSRFIRRPWNRIAYKS